VSVKSLGTGFNTGAVLRGIFFNTGGDGDFCGRKSLGTGFDTGAVLREIFFNTGDSGFCEREKRLMWA
jgi:hypothetical protein